MPSATYPVPAFASTLTVTGTFPAVYGLLAQASGAWSPVITTVSSGAGGFTLAFSVPAPGAGAEVDVITSVPTTASPAGGVTLGDYLADTRRFLRDEGVANHLYSDTDLIAFINRAMQQRDLDLGMNRVRIATPMVTQQYDYPISQILSGTILDGPLASLAAQSGVVAVAPGDFSATIVGAFPATYQLICTPIGAWSPVITTVTKTTTGADVAFNIPAPPAGASFAWIATGGGPVNAIIAVQAVAAGDVSATLSGQFGTAGFQVIATPIGAWAPVITTVATTTTSAIVSFSVPAPFGGASFAWIASGLSAANLGIIDILSVIITPLGAPPGGTRYPLARWPYSRLNYLLSTSYPTYPVTYAWFGTRNVMVAPPPANAYPTEWDFTTFSPALVNLTDTDQMTYPYTDPIPFLAAQFAKLGAQRFDEADSFNQVFNSRLQRVRSRGRPFGVTSPMFDIPRGAR